MKPRKVLKWQPIVQILHLEMSNVTKTPKETLQTHKNIEKEVHSLQRADRTGTLPLLREVYFNMAHL